MAGALGRAASRDLQNTESATLSDQDKSTARLPVWADLVVHDCRGVLIVEGPSDSKYLRIAAETSNLLDRLSVIAAGEGIDGPPTGGAALAVRHAILFAATNNTPWPCCSTTTRSGSGHKTS